MSLDLKDAAMFSVEGARFQRNNPDGSLATPTRTVGGIGPFNLSGLTANTGNIKFIIDNGSEIDLDIDFTAAASQSAVTVDEVVTAAALAITSEPVVFSKEVSTGRLQIASTGSGETYMQTYGELVGYFGIGNAASGSTLGTKFKSFFDSVTGLARAKNLKEGEEVEAEAGDGTLWTVKTSDILKGENVTFTLQKDDKEFKELVLGGTYNSTNFSYKYPNTSQTIQPTFYMEAYIPEYDKGYQDRANIEGYNQIKWLNCVASEGDISNDPKSWAPVPYNIKALEYNDGSSITSATEEFELSVADVEALGLI